MARVRRPYEAPGAPAHEPVLPHEPGDTLLRHLLTLALQLGMHPRRAVAPATLGVGFPHLEPQRLIALGAGARGRRCAA